LPIRGSRSGEAIAPISARFARCALRLPVEHRHPIAARDQRIDEVPPEKSGSTGDQRSHATLRLIIPASNAQA
jgi:hypothetical protein